MKVLLAVVNCHSREEYLDAISNTWALSVPADVDLIFFRGRGAVREPRANEVFLDCRDDYEGLPNKVQEIIRWAYIRGYDFVLKCDDDVVLLPKALLESGFERYDFSGGQEPACKPGEIKTPFGFCYWLSRRSMQLVLSSPLPGNPGSTHPGGTGNDEAWVSTVLYVHGIYLRGDLRYFLHRGTPVYRKVTPGHPRALRRDKDRPPLPTPVAGTFAWCMYLNSSGWHQTPAAEILKEFHRIWESVK